jgi:hypothetical protein
MTLPAPQIRHSGFCPPTLLQARNAATTAILKIISGPLDGLNIVTEILMPHHYTGGTV